MDKFPRVKFTLGITPFLVFALNKVVGTLFVAVAAAAGVVVLFRAFPSAAHVPAVLFKRMKLVRRMKPFERLELRAPEVRKIRQIEIETSYPQEKSSEFPRANT